MVLNNPLVSVCMPAYNAERYIAESIKSILSQSYQNWELIIVNDGSSDNTGSIAEGFSSEKVRVYHQSNLGQCAAANKAFSYSSGEFIKFFDADDLLSANMLTEQIKRLYNNKNSVASARWGRFYDDDVTTFKYNTEAVWRDMSALDWLVEAWHNAQPMMQCALWLIPRQIIESAGLWDEELSLINDFDFFTRILVNADQVLFCSDSTLYYRSGITGSLSGTKTQKGIYSAYRSIDKATSTLLKKSNNDAAKLACANIWQNFIYSTYPDHSNLITAATRHIGELVPPTLPFTAGGYSKFLAEIVGWKAVKKLKSFLS